MARFQIMSTGFSKITHDQAKREIQEVRDYVSKAAAAPEKARKLLVKAGILSKGGKQLSKQYR